MDRRRYILGIASLLVIAAAPAGAATVRENIAAEILPPAAEDRRLIANTHASPYAAIGRLEGVLICSAAIVLHPRIVLTAAHCVIDPDEGLTEKPILFRPGYQARADLGRFYGEVWDVGSLRQYGAQSAYDAANDWAILVLDRPPAGIRPLGVQRYGRTHFRALQEEVLLPTDSVDIADGRALSADQNCSVEDQIWGLLLHDCKVARGASGAPLLRPWGDWYVVIGLESRMLIMPGDRHEYGGAVSSDAFMDSLEAVHRRLTRNSGKPCAHYCRF